MDIREAEAEFIRTIWLVAQCFVDDTYRGRTVDSSRLESDFEAAQCDRFVGIQTILRSRKR